MRIHEPGSASLAAKVRLRSVANLVNLSTPMGLLVAGIGRATVARGPRGLFLGDHYRLPFPIAGAFTMGNVLITSGSWEEIQRRDPELFAHEERHVWQYAYCLGLPYLALYSAAMAWSMIRTGDRASGNFFERQAGLRSGGYVEQPARPVLAGWFTRRR